jgi:capsular polysaccharide transport system permease protein
MSLFKSLQFWLFFVVPMALGSYYYTAVASPQFEASAHFTIEKTGQASSSPLGFLTGISGPTASTRDALIIKDFIESREVIERTKDRLDLRKIYAREDKDFLSRLNTDASIEELIEYWKEKVNIEFESTSGIATLSVMAFEPEDTLTIINSVLKESEDLVNSLSEKSRQDSLKFARSELSRAEDKLKNARNKLQGFVEKEKALNPEKNVEATFSLVAGLQSELANAEANLNSLRKSLHDNTPKVRTATNKVSALKRQIKKEQSKINRTSNKKSTKTMSAVIADREALLTEQGFAEKAYASALLSLENARVSATQHQRYLTVIVKPQLPEKAAKPSQPHDYIVLFLSCLLLWGILGLIIASIKDHAGWM